MIDQFVTFCLHRRIAVIILAVLFVGFGIYAWETLSVEAYPELGDVASQVTTQGASADPSTYRTPATPRSGRVGSA